MQWEKWDPDVQKLEDVSGDCADGTTLVFVMKDGPIPKIPVTLSGVKDNECLHYHGGVLRGTINFDASIEISIIDDITSHVKYSFDMNGIFGSLVNWYNPTPVISGVEQGLENIKNLSEAASR